MLSVELINLPLYGWQVIGVPARFVLAPATKVGAA